LHGVHTVLPNGNHLALSTELRTVSGFAAPLCGEVPGSFGGSYDLVADVVVEFDPTYGTVVNKWSLFDYYDAPGRPAAPDMCPIDPASFPGTAYPGRPAVHDWTHADAVVLDEARNALIVSVGHLDELLALRWHDDDAGGTAGEVLWRMGPNGDLTLTSGRWMHHPQAPEVQPNGAILLYDRGGDAPVGDERSFSRVVQYVVDDETGQVSQEWAYRSHADGLPVFSGLSGDVQRQINGNVLLVDGGILGAAGEGSSQVSEVTPDASQYGATEAFSVRVDRGDGWVVDAATRVALFAPDG
jgi:hypothetical protein